MKNSYRMLERGEIILPDDEIYMIDGGYTRWESVCNSLIGREVVTNDCVRRVIVEEKPKSQMEQDLDELHIIVKNLDNLLNDRQYGNFCWLSMVINKMKEMKIFTDRVMKE